MAGVAAQFQRASFGGIDIAVERYTVKGRLRHGVHEYRHTPGGQPEKQGRALYVVELDAMFSAAMSLYPNAFPDEWDRLLSDFEQEKTKDLVIPHIGTMKAFCTDWPVDVDFRRNRDGLRTRLVFLEDQQQPLTLINGSINPDALPAKSNSLIEDLFSSISGLIDDIASAGDYYEMQAELYQDKVAGIITACQRVDEKVSELNDPKNWKVVRANAELAVAAIEVLEKLSKRLAPVVDFIAPATMSVVDISMAIYGDTSHALELMQLNRNPIIADPFSITPGTVIKAYAPPLP